MIVNACNPSHFGGEDWEDGQSSPDLRKMLKRPCLNKQARSSDIQL